MKILFLGNGNDPREIGGVQTFSRNLAEMFMEEFTFLLLYENIKGTFNIKNKKYICFHKRNFFLKVLDSIFKQKWQRKVLSLKSATIKKDIVLMTSPNEINFLNKGAKKVLVQHNLCKILWEKEEYFNKDDKILKKLKEELDFFIALSSKDRDEISSFFDFPIGKIKVIRHSSDIELLNCAKNKNKNIIMICRLKNCHKRIDLAIKSMKKLPQYTLNIYGEGPDRKELEELVKKLSLPNVIFYGATKEVQKKLDENGIFVMTSDYEGYGITNIEAMRRGLPIILRDTFTAASDIVKGNGVLLPKEWNEDEFVKGIHSIYKNYEGYSKNSLKQGKRHSFEVIMKEWENLFEELMRDEKPNIETTKK